MATIKERIDGVTEDVTQGKTVIASAITEKGVDTSSSATFSTMADNIRNIESGGLSDREIAFLRDISQHYGCTIVIITHENAPWDITYSLYVDSSEADSVTIPQSGGVRILCYDGYISSSIRLDNGGDPANVSVNASYSGGSENGLMKDWGSSNAYGFWKNMSLQTGIIIVNYSY